MDDWVSTGVLADAAVLEKQREKVMGPLGRSVVDCMLEALIGRT